MKHFFLQANRLLMTIDASGQQFCGLLFRDNANPPVG
jgi:hypothetical protein